MRSSGRIRRLLLVRNDGLGDLVLTLPAIEAMRGAFPSARIAAFVSPAAADLLRDTPQIDEVIVDRPNMSVVALSQQLASYAFDAALLFRTTTRLSLATWLAGVPIRVCWAGRFPGILFGTRRVLVRRSHPPIHESEFALEFVRKLAPEARMPACPPHREADHASRAFIRERLSADLGATTTLFAVHPGSHRSAYNWPLWRYAELVTRLTEFGSVAVTGSPGEKPILSELRRAVPPSRRDRVALYADLTLPALMALLGEVQCLTVSSTGPMHVAALVGTPTVALFSAHPAHSPQKWAPFGNGTTILQAPLMPGENPAIRPERGDEHMDRISVRSVLRANLQIIARRSSRRTQSALMALEGIPT